MTSDVIQKFLESGNRKNSTVSIHFRQRNTISGMFVRAADYDELKSKNFWRIVSASRIPEWKKTKDINLAKIFSGSEFTRLTDD